jgi:zinc-dependent metalloproteinase lipoprotein
MNINIIKKIYLRLKNVSIIAVLLFTHSISFFVMNFSVFAQENPIENRCANLQVPKYFEQTEKLLQKTLTEQQNLQQNSQFRTERTETVYTIPIIFHIMHQGEAVGEGNNISYEQILSQMTVLNEDFNKLNADTIQTQAMFKSVSASANIKFVLASIDNNGNKLAEAGVDRQKISKKIWDLNEFNQQIAPNTIWNPTQYLNVWVIDSLTVNNSGYVGYGQFPDINAADLAGLPSDIKLPSASANTDGVVMDYNNTGAYRLAKTPQLARARLNQGRTLTHEIGHFLGVRHVFSDNGICEDDFCGDTPIQSNATRIFTPCELVIGRTTCGSVSMVQNFMDYSHDICMNIFTKDQVARMRIVLEKSPRRKELLTSPVLTAIEDENIATKILIYPNPATDKIYIQNLSAMNFKSYKLQNTLGQLVLQGNLSEIDSEILLPKIAKGLYFLEISTTTAKVVKKLIIE